MRSRTALAVADGVLTAGATRYRVLYLGGSSARMTVRALRRIAELVEAGATVVGRRPLGPARRWRTTTPNTRGSATCSGRRTGSG